MKTGRTLQELAAEIESQRTRKVDFVAPTDALTVVPTGDKANPVGVEVHGAIDGTFPMRDLAMTQAAQHVGIPVPYARMMAEQAPDLLATNLNRWFQMKPQRRLIRLLDGQERAFLSDRYQRIDNFDICNAVLPILHDFDGLTVRSCEVTESRLYLKATINTLQREVKSKRVGDVVEAGVMFTNSEVGLGAWSVTPYALFLICTNGMVRDGGKRWTHVGKKIEGDAMAYLTDETVRASDRVDLMVMRDTVRHLLSSESFDKWVAKLNGATEQAITGRVPAAIEVLTEKLTLTQGEGDSILKHLIEGGDLSRYGLMNAVTRTAEDAVSYDRATDLEGLGQRIIDLPANDWREISEAA